MKTQYENPVEAGGVGGFRAAGRRLGRLLHDLGVLRARGRDEDWRRRRPARAGGEAYPLVRAVQDSLADGTGKGPGR